MMRVRLHWKIYEICWTFEEMSRIRQNILSQGHLDKSKPAVKEVTERPCHGQELNPVSKMLWELEVPAEGSAELIINYAVKMWK